MWPMNFSGVSQHGHDQLPGGAAYAHVAGAGHLALWSTLLQSGTQGDQNTAASALRDASPGSM